MHKRKREPHTMQASMSMSPNADDEDHEFKSHKRTASRNTSSIFTRLASEDSERRDSPIDDEDDEEEMMLVNAYHNSNQAMISPTSKQDYNMAFSPVSSFFHPAILRATTICESASDICPFGGDPPEVDSRPSSPVDAIGDVRDEITKTSESKCKKDDCERPSWLTGTPRAFNLTLKSDAPTLFSSPWSGVFQLGSS
jgi:hypothetical protein